MADKLRVGWIGTGVMGAPMAGHLLAAGYPVTVFNRTEAKAEGLLKKGAAWAPAPADVARQSDVVFTIVGFPVDVQGTYLGRGGICSALRPDQVTVDMTTSPPSLAVEIAAAAAKAGASALDAPVSGGQIGAESAKLTIMVGGDKASFDRILPLFQTLGKAVTYIGPAGCGQHCKMVNQILIAGAIVALAEGLAYTKECGLKPEAVLEAVSQGSAASWSLTNTSCRET